MITRLIRERCLSALANDCFVLDRDIFRESTARDGSFSLGISLLKSELALRCRSSAYFLQPFVQR